MTKPNKRIKTLNQLIQIVKKLKKQGKKIVTTNGVFDILHFGHIKYLEDAKRLGDVLIVGVNSDKSVKENKGDKRPINDEKSRLAVLAAIESVDYVFLFNEKDPRKWLEKIKPDIHVKAGDYKMGQIIEKDVVEGNGGKIAIAKALKGYSTTKTINRILGIYGKQ
ncbi:D-glycero-beta-D-manno-heptose 1-phosphate adenylyltransferase [Candidatus Woesearchaeota archaeon]|nr:D-glycero-beta-D-manno-heptose 1-phosphate adenylyltransferase [Candidatus Woesearchaeota archaeon]